MFALVASIPSPSSSSLHIGPVRLTAYGLMIALGVAAAMWLVGRRAEARHLGSDDDVSAVGMWALAGGLIGARLYHVATAWDRFSSDPGSIPAVWRGGLGIPGGLAGGVLVGLFVAHRRGIDLRVMLDIAAPAIALAQAIGRWGNWWNQELFGGPTTLPWALEIDNAHLPAGYPPGTTFHPTFLYESMWSLALCGVLLLVDRRASLRAGRLFVLYLGGYFLGRFWIEGLRIDPAAEFAGVRWNQWVSIVVLVTVTAFVMVDRRWASSRRSEDAEELCVPAVGSEPSNVT